MTVRRFKNPYKLRRVSRKDYTRTFAAAPLPAEVLMVSRILNQGNAPSCTAYAGVAIRESMTGHAYDPEMQWDAEQQFVGGNVADGIKLKDQLACGVKTGFFTQGNPLPIDKASRYIFLKDLSFNGIKQALGRNIPLSCGLNWYYSFDTQDGIVPHITENLLGGHDVKVAGFTVKNGIEYIVVQNSWGEGYGANGLFYFDRWTTEHYLTQYALGYWSDDPDEKIQKYGLLQALLQNVVALYQALIAQVKPTGSWPPEPRPQQISRIQDWAKAIAAQEGAKPALNNPGNLKYSTLTASWGGEKGFQALDGGWICKFATYEAGFTALCNFLTLGAQDELLAFHQARTLRLFTRVYAQPPKGSHYAENVAKELGVDVDYPISKLL